MPAYNAGRYVGEAIQSILDQTFPDFELIIINDGSTDNTQDIIQSFRDHRLKILNNSANFGNYPSRNKGLRVAGGKYICVMDADDVALKQRLEKQYLYMEKHPETGLAGSGFRYYGTEQNIFRENNYERIKVLLLRNICFMHPTLIIRSDFLRKFNLQYNEKYYYASDYDFLVRAARVFPVTNIPEVLLNYRIHNNQISAKNSQEQHKYVIEIIIEQLGFIGIRPNETEVSLHTDLITGKYVGYNKKQLLYAWIDKILSSNQKINFYKKDELNLFFDSLLILQLLRGNSKTIRFKPNLKLYKNKTDLLDVTFAITMRIDSQCSEENIDTVLRYLLLHFNTKIIVLEVDSVRNYFSKHESGNIKYEFIKDDNQVFRRTKWINHLISRVETQFVAVWDIWTIAPLKQIIETVEKIVTGKAFIGIPHDGRFYSCDRGSSDLFKKTYNTEVLTRSMNSMELIHGYYSSGGAFIVNKEKYLALGGENEAIAGFGIEDDERLKRIEILGLPVFFSKGPLFRLWHPKEKNNLYAGKENEIKSRVGFLRTCELNV